MLLFLFTGGSFQSDEFPAFYSAASGCRSPLRFDTILECARLLEVAFSVLSYYIIELVLTGRSTEPFYLLVLYFSLFFFLDFILSLLRLDQPYVAAPKRRSDRLSHSFASRRRRCGFKAL